MAKYGPKAHEAVERELKEMKEGKLRMGRSGKKVTNPKQAIAIALSEARREGAKMPPPPEGSPSAEKEQTGAKKAPAKKSSARPIKKTPAKKASTSKKTSAKKASAKTATGKKVTAKAAASKKAPAKKTSAKRTPARKVT